MAEFILDHRELNLDMAADCIKNFSLACGVGCTLSSLDGNRFFSTGFSCSECSLCSFMQSDHSKTSEQCFNAHLYGMQQAERFGGKYIYFCPAGLTCFVTPIMRGGYPQAFVTAGPILMVEPEDFINYDMVDLLNIPEEDFAKAEQIVRQIPYYLPEKVNALSGQLFMTTAFFNNIDQYKKMLEDQTSAELQGQIGEYLKSVKADEQSAIHHYPFEKEHELVSAISDGNKQESQRLLNDILGHIFFTYGSDFRIIRARIYELLVLLSRASIDGGADSNIIFQLNYRYLNEINQLATIDELCIWLSNVMNRFTDYVFRFSDVKHIDVIRKAVDYIRKNYAGKITLEEVAAHVYLSPSYFSKIFKDEMNCNFNSYLNRYRIEKSKVLLLNEKVRLVDISGLVGFEDQSYFSKVFKRLIGVTPGKFRESRGKIPSESKPAN